MDKRLGSCLYLLPFGQKLTVLTDAGVAGQLDLPFEPAAGIKVIEERNSALKGLPSSDLSNVVIFLTSSRLSDSIVRRRIRHCSLEPISSYLVVPGFSNPRWFLPNNRTLIKKSGNMIKPSSVKARIAWFLTKLMNSFGLPQLIFPDRLIVAVNTDAGLFSNGVLKDFLASTLSEESIEFIVYTGHSYYQKCTVQVMDDNGAIIAYAKIGSTEQARKRIEDEGKALKELALLSLSRLIVPELISLENLEGTPAKVLVQAPPPDGYDELKRRLENRHIDALIELFQTRKKIIQGKELAFGMTRHIQKFSNEQGKHHAILDEIDKAIFDLAPCLSGKEIILGGSHGDFTPWNIYLKGQNIFVFDWELFSLRLPLWDIYNFILHSEVFIFHRNARELLKMLSDPNGRYLALIDRYERLMGTSQTIDRGLLLSCYLIEIMIFYIDISMKQESSGFEKDLAAETIIGVASSMLGMISGGAGNV